MKKYVALIFLMLLGLLPARVLAASPPTLVVPSGLSLAEIKITGNEFVMLQNNTGTPIPDLSKYWLYVFNNVNPLAAGVSSSSQQLPTGSLASGQTVLLSTNGGSTCGAAITAKLSLSLNDSGGFLEVMQTSLSVGTLVQTAGDSVSWSSGANTAAGMIANVPSATADPAGAYYRHQNTTLAPPFLWQQASVDSSNSCQLNVKIANTFVPGPSNPGSQLLPGTPPPATIVVDEPSQPSSNPTSNLPPADIGLAAPQINELLPNPASPQTDDEDEFIELYNSNDVAFDLSGFKLQTGTTSLHSYTFPAGTSLPPKGFVAFFSIDTNLKMSNGGGQAHLLDPLGNVISQSDPYPSAPDGQSWALANGTWYWTSTPTAGGANVIHQPLTTNALTTGASPAAVSSRKSNPSASVSPPASNPTSSASTKVKAATTNASSNNNTNSSSSPSAPKTNSNSSPLHPLVLAGVGAGAVAYAAYEYRHDLRNRLYQFRRYRAARAAAGQLAKKS
ncbi:hypothetical protein BVY00_00810 [bacterium G20]|nr:hypothetical protein BVY00_00810 [bacterium G20]